MVSEYRGDMIASLLELVEKALDRRLPSVEDLDRMAEEERMRELTRMEVI